MLTPDEAARKVANSLGGLTKAPTVVHIETRQPEVLDETPLQKDVRESVVYPKVNLARVPSWPPDLEDDMLHWGHVIRREYVIRSWIVVREEFVPPENALHSYGYWRVHRFIIWVPEESDPLTGTGDQP